LLFKLLNYKSQSSSPNRNPSPIIANINANGLRIAALPIVKTDQTKIPMMIKPSSSISKSF
ncbi:hypothetical protein KJ691_08775, partial [bacterium]|nr:hypothetical protein [bacterium]